MSYQGGNPHQEGHDLQQYPPSTYHMPPPRDYDSDDDQERVPLNTQQPRASPFEGPFDERGGQQQAGYTLEEQYAPASAPGYTETPGYDQPRVPSPYNRSETSSTEAWRQRQAPQTTGGLRRYATRKIKLTAGQALSIDHPVPSAIQNAIQAKYRQADVEGGSEEFTHMRCNNTFLHIFRSGPQLKLNLKPRYCRYL